MNKVSLCMIVSGIVIFLLSGVSFAQDPELPLDWEGEGEATFIGSEGEQEIDFDIEIHVDTEGMVTGHTSTDDGQAQIERMYYSDEVDAQYPGLDSRKLILVLSIRGGDTPLLVIMDGRALGDKYFYGELRLAELNASGMKDALDIGNKEATLVSTTSLPSGVKKALKESIATGYFEVKGKKAAKE